MKFLQGRHPTTTALIDPPRLRDCNSDCNRHLNCQVHAISVSVLVSFSLVRVFCPAGQWVVICPYQRLRCILYSLCLRNCLALTCLATPPRLASPRLASFGLIAHRTGSPYPLALKMRAVRISSRYQPPIIHIPPPKTRA